MKFRKIPLAALVAFTIAGSASATTLLVNDNFNSTSLGSGNINSTLGADQTGSVATVGYSYYDAGGSYMINHGNGGAMELWGGFYGNKVWVSLNRDFATDANAANQPLEIQFDVAGTVPGYYPFNQSWLGFGLGAAQGTFFGSQPVGKQINLLNLTSTTYKLVFSDLAGTGSAFNGITNGAKVDYYINGIFQSTSTTTLSSGYITFDTDPWDADNSGNHATAYIDNLSVSLIPEPSAALLGGLGLLCLLRRRR